MSFPRYPAYKDSGVEWIGQLPKYWAAVRLKNVLAQRITDGPHLTPIFTSEGVPFLSVDGIQDGELTFESCRYIADDDHAEFSKKVLPRRDDLLMGKAASTGKIARVKVDFEFSIWSPLALIRIDRQAAMPAFVEYALKSPETQAEIDVLCTSNTQKNISMDDIPRLALACPSLEEQACITAFLDHETAKIDALVAEQEKLIELLKEKRQAVISHAVTKGLDPSVPMKDSGVEWLGEVPAHWASSPLKYFTTFAGGGTPSRDNLEFWNGSIPWVSPKDMKVSEIADTEEKITLSGLKNSTANIIEPGAVLIVVRSGILKHSIPVGTNSVQVALNQDMKALTFDASRCVSKFFFRWVQGLNDQLLLAWSKQGATVESIEHAYLADTLIPLPSVKEQEEISIYLDRKIVEIESLIYEAESATSLLKERRTALISAAVTGQIDVRGEAQQSTLEQNNCR